VVALGELAGEVVAGAESVGTGVRAEVAGDREDAVRRVLAGVAPGDVILVKASRGLALDTVAAALVAADPVGPDDEQGEGSA
jgi:UDP-N-acetylmuramoyl-tripeptide--D-alanyl-D-alanine ligase